MNSLEVHTRRLRDSGRKLLAPYLIGGVSPDWTDHLRAAEAAGADVIEVGLPFSDPMLDGPTIQEASDRALRRGATVAGILHELASLALCVPVVAMTYANLVLRDDGFCDRLADAGVSGLIVPDLPVDEVGALSTVAAERGVDLVLLVAPSTAPARRREIARRSRGYVYAVNHMGTTGARHDVADAGAQLAASLRRDGDLPVLVGFGLATVEQAAAASRHADGVAVGSALVRIVSDGARPADVGARVARLRAALDAGEWTRAAGDGGSERAEVRRHRSGPDGQDPVGLLPGGAGAAIAT